MSDVEIEVTEDSPRGLPDGTVEVRGRHDFDKWLRQ